MNFALAENQYKKFSELKKDEVLKLLEWIKQQPHLPKISEFEAILFLHACNYSMEFTKETMDIYYTARTHCPEFFSNRDVYQQNLIQAMDIVAMFPLPKLTPNGYKVMMMRLVDFDASKFVFADALKLYNMCFDLWLMEEGIIKGYVIVIDMSGCTLGHAARLGPLTLKKFLYFIQEASLARLKGLHFINIVPFIYKILALVKPFMKAELVCMLHVHSSMDTVYEFIPNEILPKENGGNEGSYIPIYKNVYENLKRNSDYFINEEKTRRVDEKQRPGKPKNASDLFGVEGNFRKLDID